jgi:type I restriction enzyme S subunit
MNITIGLPDNWRLVNIEDIADVKGGKRLPKGETLQEEKNNHPYIRVSDMYMGGIELDNILYVPNEIFPLISRYIINKDDLFISVAGTLGIVGEIPAELDGANLTENANKLSNIKINKEFLLQTLLSTVIQDAVKKEQTNNAQPKLALTRIRTFKIPLPPLPEQQKIAKILGTVDAKIEIINQQILETQELKKGLMQQLLTKGIGHTEFKDSALGKIPKSWEVVPIYELRNKDDRYGFTGGPFGSDLKSENYTETGVKIIQLQNIGEGKFIDKGTTYTSEEKADELSSCNIFPNEIILAKMAPVARCCKVPNTDERYVMCSDGIRLSVDTKRFDNEFVFQALNSKYFRDEAESKSTGTTRARIGLKDLKLIPILVPENIDEQKNLAEILSTADHKLEVLSEKKITYQEMKQGLMQQLLTGKVRV